MAKLFSGKEVKALALESDGVEPREVLDTGVLDDIEDAAETLEISSSASAVATEQLALAQSMRDGFGQRKILSQEYLTTLEGYKDIARKLGVKHLPGMEDFRNKYAAQSAHDYAVEGFKEVIKNFWEKVKNFFKAFFKKITVFFKRLLKANLDLESYDKYTEHLIAKLNANKATMSDNGVLHSKLPNFLAGRGDTSIDSDYVLRAGSIKIKTLVKVAEDLKASRESSLLSPGALNKYSLSIKALEEAYKAGFTGGIEQVTGLCDDLKSAGLDLVMTLFKHQLPEYKAAPEEVYMAITQHFDREALGDKSFGVHSMFNMFSDFNGLPRNSNIFFAYASSKTDSGFVTRGHMDDLSFVESKLNPISNLANLTNFYKEYKNGIAKVDLKGVSKSADDVSTICDKMITDIAKTMPAMIEAMDEQSRSVGGGGAVTDLMGSIISLIKSAPSLKADGALKAFISGITPILTPHETNSGNGNDFVRDLTRILSPGQTPIADSLLKTTIINANTYIKSEEWQNVYKAIREIAGVTAVSPDIEAIRDELRKINSFLPKLFTQLQLIYKEIGTTIYQQITEIRYAMIKYIYDSASRFSY